MFLTNLAIKKFLPLPKIEEYNRFLVVGPHPDDMEIGCGATIARLAAEGKQVCVLICTDGRYGDGFFPEGTSTDEVISTRIKEAKASAKMLGVTDLRFLGLSDGAFYTNAELLNGIAQTISDFQPDVIFAPDPAVNSECHQDHLNVGKAVRQLACFGSNPGIMAQYGGYKPAKIKAVAFYMTAKTNYYVDTTNYFELQNNAIFSSFLTQYPEGTPDRSNLQLYLKIRSIDCGLHKLSRHAEGFRVLGGVHAHCLPEAHV